MTLIRPYLRLLLEALVILAFLDSRELFAQSADTGICTPCQRPGEFRSFHDSVMDVELTNGSVLRNIRSAARTTLEQFGEVRQAIRITFETPSGPCSDTLLSAESVLAFLHEGIGGSQSPLRYPVAPAREIMRTSAHSPSRRYVEVLGVLGYGGRDTSSRAIGFGGVVGSIEAIVAPFGDLLGQSMSLGIGGGLLDEGSRIRFPLYAELRFDWPDGERLETVTRYYPDSCAFAVPGDTAVGSPWSEFTGRDLGRSDKTVFLTRDRTVFHAAFRPYVYLDAGTVFDSKFEGEGSPANAVNPEFRKPLLFGAGVGHPFGDAWTLALGYRYMQLHLATPCPQCVDRSIINRNTVHAIMLRAGWRMPW